MDNYYRPLLIDVDPYSGRILATRSWGETLTTWLYELHASLLVGRYASAESGLLAFKVITFLGLLLMLSALSGLYLWWPRGWKAAAFKIKTTAGRARFKYDLHRVIGLYACTMLFILAFTGFSFGHRHWVTSAVSGFSSVNSEPFQDPPHLKSHPTPSGRRISLQEAAAISARQFPDTILRWLATPAGAAGYYSIERLGPGEATPRRPRHRVWIGQYSGAILQAETPRELSAGEVFLDYLWPLHNGQIFGLPGRILFCLTGFAPLQARKAHPRA